MNYSGNPSLSSDVQKRILDTFEQTLGLVEEGSRQEALLGCDFVLRMDPQFEPARRLQERLRASAGAVVEVDDLRRQLQGSAAPPPPPADNDPFGGLDTLDLDLPELPADFHAGLRPELEALLAQRRFPELMALAERERAAVMADPGLLQVIEQAQSRMEAEPYVTKFAASARAALQAGQDGEAGKLIEKARALDPSHPVLAELEAARRSAAGIGGGGLAAPEDMGFDLSLDADPEMGLGAASETSFGSLGLDLDEPAPAAVPVPAAVPAAGAKLFAGTENEPEPRIRELLAEGQKAFAAGDPQSAIDAWSRIFLIDIDHQEAARRIEMARKVRAEKERQVEEIFHEGVDNLAAGDMEGAKRSFQRVLEIQPAFFQAREYLQQLEAGHVPVIAHKATTRETMAPPPPAEVLPGLDDLGGPSELKEEILVPPDPGEMPARTAERKPRAAAGPAREGKARRLFVVVGTAVLLLVLGGGWYVYQNREQLFPNSQAPEEASTPEPDPITRAVALQRAGKTSMAVSQLKRMLPSDPQYQRAQALIAEWEGTAGSGSVAPSAPAVPVALSEERLALLASAHQAHTEGSYLRAIELLNQAAAKAKLEPAESELLADAKRKIEPIAPQLEFFRQQEWEYVIPELWRKHEANPGDRDVKRLLVDSYYNLGLQDLQGTDPTKAVEKFEEARKLAPEDEMIRRQHAFAKTYEERPIDLLYRIYVKYLPFRS